MLFSSSAANAGKSAVLLLHQYETTANPLIESVDGLHKYPQIIKLPHLEIPLSWLDANMAKNFDPATKKALIFTNKTGVQMFRWVLAPGPEQIGQPGENTTLFNDEIIDFVHKKGGDTTIHHYFTGYPTSSTTYNVEDPETHAIFFYKTSNSMSPAGRWSVKPRKAWEANDARLINDYLLAIQAVTPFKYFTFFEESASFLIPQLDRSVIIRDAGDMKNKETKFFYLPVFSVTDEKVGREIAEKNGSSDPAHFWNQHLPKLLAAATTELFLRTGLALDSPHGQNFLIELDANMKLTGRIVIRDLADVFILKYFYELFKDKFGLKNFTQKKNIKDRSTHELMAVPLATGYGWSDYLVNHAWLPAQETIIQGWQTEFTVEADRVLKEITGMNSDQYRSSTEILTAGSKYQLKLKDGMIYTIEFDQTKAGWSNYLNKTENLFFGRTIKSCFKLF